jgi:hypothetical protein
VTPTPLPGTIGARAEAPKELEVGRSSSVTLSLLLTAPDPSPVPDTPGNTVVVGTVVVSGTPGVPLPEIKGPGYRATARGIFESTEFKVQPASHDFRSISGDRLDWRWSVSSSSPGSQVILLRIEVEWTSVDGSRPTIREELWSTAIDVRVTKPFITFGQLQLGTLAMGFISSGLTVPFLYGILKERRNKTRDQQDRPAN